MTSTISDFSPGENEKKKKEKHARHLNNFEYKSSVFFESLPFFVREIIFAAIETWAFYSKPGEMGTRVLCLAFCSEEGSVN